MKVIEYLFNNIIDIKAEDAFELHKEQRKTKIPTLIYVTSDKDETFIWYSTRDFQPILENLPEDTNYSIKKLDCFGGCIVSSYKDLNFAVSFPIPQNPSDPEKFELLFINSIVNVLNRDYNIEAYVDGNDILIPDGKISGTAATHVDEVFQQYISLSLVDHKHECDAIGMEYSENKKPSFAPIDNKEEFFEKIKNEVLLQSKDW